MLTWAIIFLVISVIAAVFGFTGISAATAGIAKILFFVAIVIFAVLLLMALFGGALVLQAGRWGFVLQGGRWNDPLPWALSLPLGLAILPAIVLSSLPDSDADREAGKRTLAVRFGAARRGVQAPIVVALLFVMWFVLWPLSHFAQA